ncbi:MAG: miaA [Pseudomonadota bacterium]|jgi:tRNA dimethylallyltransferase
MSAPASQDRPLVVVTGPTGCGKSALALALAERVPVELVSVDSAQVYRGMDIGTAKPSLAEQSRVPHHLIDLRDPEQSYSAGEFRKDCLAAIEAIEARGRVPVLVGGTMLYLRALFHGLAELPGADPAVRRSIDARALRDGWPALHEQLRQQDPDSAARIHPNDAQRVQRALEIIALTGMGPSALWRAQGDAAAVVLAGRRLLVVVLDPEDRAALHGRLAMRLDAMIQHGFTDEVRALQGRAGLTVDSPAMRAVGYRQLWRHCEGHEPLALAREKALHATRQLAKRQLTWLRGGNVFPSGATLLKSVMPATVSDEPNSAAVLQWLERAI